MFRFANPEILYFLALLPLMFLLYLFVKKRYYARMRAFGDLTTLAKLTPDASWKKTLYKMSVITLAFVFLIIAAARPQMGAKLKEAKQEGVEIMFVVDVSNSMLADDFQPSRLERTKNAINTLLDKFTNDRVGLIVFAGRAYVQLPITSDYIAAKSFVDYISPGMIPSQGTSITEALKVALKSFSSESSGSRAVILISDGENHEGDPLPIAEKMAEEGIVISTIGIGTPAGVALKIEGKAVTDEKGNIVVTKLNEDILKQIAMTTGGTYIKASNASMGLNELVAQIKTMKNREFSTTVFDAYNELYQYFLSIGLFLILLEFSLLERRNRVITRMKLFNLDDKK